MTNRQKQYFDTLCRLCRELGRPVTAAEVATAKCVTIDAARKMLERLVFKGDVAWMTREKRCYYCPRLLSDFGYAALKEAGRI